MPAPEHEVAASRHDARVVAKRKDTDAAHGSVMRTFYDRTPWVPSRGPAPKRSVGTSREQLHPFGRLQRGRIEDPPGMSVVDMERRDGAVISAPTDQLSGCAKRDDQ